MKCKNCGCESEIPEMKQESIQRKQNALILLEEKAEALRLEISALECEIRGLK